MVATIKYKESISSQKQGGILKLEYGGQPISISSAEPASYHDKFDESKGVKQSKKEAEKSETPVKDEEVLIENSSNVEGVVQPKSSRSRRNNNK